MIAGNQMVHIDEDELLEELETLKESRSVVGDGIIRVDGEIIKLPSVPDTEIKIEPEIFETTPKKKEVERERVLITE